MGIGAAIAAAIILAPFFVLYVTDAYAPDIAAPIRVGIPSDDALEPPSTPPSREILLANASPVLGNPNAPVTLVEFGDYQCHFCHKHFVETEPTIISRYVATGALNMVFKDFIIIGPDSITAAHSSRCAADQGMFWEMHHAIYTGYEGERTGWASAEGVRSIAYGIDGLDTAAWDECMRDMLHIETINASTLDARSLGLGGTPAFYIIGADGEITMLRGAKHITEFAAAIDGAINS